MKSLHESLLDVPDLAIDDDAIPYITKHEFQSKYANEQRPVVLSEKHPIMIKDTDLFRLCADFKTSSIDLSGLVINGPIHNISNFAANCKNLIEFIWGDSNEYTRHNIIMDDPFGFFDGNRKLKKINISGLAKYIKTITSISYMFNHCEVLKSIDISEFNLKKLSSISYAFNECSFVETINLGDANAIIKNIDSAFNKCICLKIINAPNIIIKINKHDLFDTFGTFNSCSSLESINIKYIDISDIVPEMIFMLFGDVFSLENVRIKNFGKFDMRNNSQKVNLSWAMRLSDESWDYLWSNSFMCAGLNIILPESKKDFLLKKYNEKIFKKNKYTIL